MSVDWSNPTLDLAYLHGKPEISADFRTVPEDFIVEEVLGFEPSGEGQHVCLFIQKRGENTQYVAKQLAELAGIRARDVSYGGLKDRHAVTRQWFSVQVGLNQKVDFSVLNSDSIQILKTVRHNKKLRIGAHKANRFEIVLRNISDMAAFEDKIQPIARQGVPNYFGEQRFGKNGSNLYMAQRMFSGENIRDRKVRSLVISAARSWLFNLQVSKRLQDGLFAKALDGDIFRLAGSRSYFSDTLNEEIHERLASRDIQIAGLLSGEQSQTQGEALNYINQALREYQAWADGLCAMRVKADYRPMALFAEHLSVEAFDQNCAKISFELPVGSFATAVLREWVVTNNIAT